MSARSKVRVALVLAFTLSGAVSSVEIAPLQLDHDGMLVERFCTPTAPSGSCFLLPVVRLTSGNRSASLTAGLDEPAAAVIAVGGAVTTKDGWPRLIFNAPSQSPLVARLNTSGLATLAQDRNGLLFAFDARGNTVDSWSTPQLPPGLTQAAVDIDGDGIDEILVPGGFNPTELNLLTATGDSVPGWPLVDGSASSFGTNNPVGISLGQEDGLLVVASTNRGRVHVTNSASTPVIGWPVQVPPTRFPVTVPVGIATGDIAGDSAKEIVVGVGNNRVLFAYDINGEVIHGFPRSVPGQAAWPSLGDLDEDGKSEIVLWGGIESGTIGSPGIHVFNGDGTPLNGWPQLTPAIGNFTPAIGDVDQDGQLEVVASTINGGSEPGGVGEVYVWNHDGTLLPGWPIRLPSISLPAPPTIGDVDGDGVGDIVVSGLSASLDVGVVYAFRSDRSLVAGFPIVLPGQPIVSSGGTFIADIDRDGYADLGVSALLGGTGGISIHWFELGVRYRVEGMQWPMRNHDRSRTSQYTPAATIQPSSVSVNPSRLRAGFRSPRVTVRLSLPGDAAAASELRIIKVNDAAIQPIDGLKLGNRPGFPFRPMSIFQFSGEAVRQTLPGPGIHTLVFQTEAIEGEQPVIYEAKATMTLEP